MGCQEIYSREVMVPESGARPRSDAARSRGAGGGRVSEHREGGGLGLHSRWCDQPGPAGATDGNVTVSASWKTVDIQKRGITRLGDGTIERNFSDSYKYEIAACELDKLIGVGLVPPTVER